MKTNDLWTGRSFRDSAIDGDDLGALVIRNGHCVLRVAHNDVRLAVDLLSGEKWQRTIAARELYTPQIENVSHGFLVLNGRLNLVGALKTGGEKKALALVSLDLHSFSRGWETGKANCS